MPDLDVLITVSEVYILALTGNNFQHFIGCARDSFRVQLLVYCKLMDLFSKLITIELCCLQLRLGLLNGIILWCRVKGILIQFPRAWGFSNYLKAPKI